MLKDESLSGGDPSRPAFNALWEHVLAQRVDVVVCWKIDRIARSLADMSALEEELRRQSVSLHSCTEPIDTTTAQGRFVFGILATAGQLERELGSQRVVSILQERAARGQWLHPIAPFGYALGKKRSLRIHPTEGPQVQQVFEAHAEEGSYAAAAHRMNVAGSMRRGRRWTAGTVQRVIENSIHVGVYEHWRQRVSNPRLRLVSDDVWARAAQVRRLRPRAGRPARLLARQSSIARVFDQYVAGLEFLDEEPVMQAVK